MEDSANNKAILKDINGVQADIEHTDNLASAISALDVSLTTNVLITDGNQYSKGNGSLPVDAYLGQNIVDVALNGGTSTSFYAVAQYFVEDHATGIKGVRTIPEPVSKLFSD